MDILSRTRGRWTHHRNNCDQNPQQQQQQRQQHQKERNHEEVYRFTQASSSLPPGWCPKPTLSPSPGPERKVLTPSRHWVARAAIGLTAAAAMVAWTLLSSGQETSINSTKLGATHGDGRKVWTATAGGASEGGDGRRASTTSSRGRVAVCFFGLARSLRWTVPSIERRLLGVLREDGFEVDVFLHTYSLLEVDNTRAKEQGIQYARFQNDFRVLNSTRSLMTNQDDLDLVVPNPISLTKYDWVYSRRVAAGVIRNVFRAYWSQAMVWSLMAEYAVEADIAYDAVVLARPDVWFHKDIDLRTRVLPLPERAVFIPSFDTEMWDGGQINDRFAYGSMAAMKVYMNRIATFTDPDAAKYTNVRLNSEWVLGHHLKVHNIAVNTFDFSLTRVRLTGDIPRLDQERVSEACLSGSDPIACEMVRLGYRMPVEGGKY